MLTIGILMITYGTVYADEVQFPTFTTDGLTGMDVQTFYPSNSTYTVQIVLQYHVEHPLEVPETLTWFGIDSTLHEIKLQEDFRFEHFPTEEVEENNSAQEEADRIDAILDQKKLELAQAQPELDKYRLCLEEFKEEYPIKFQAWERIGTLIEFELSYQQLYSDHPDVAETNANKKHQECEIRKVYPFVGAYEANKVVDGLTESETTNLDQTMSTPTTDEDIRQQEIIAEAFTCSDQGKSQGLCKDYLAGDAYTKPQPRLPAWYGTYTDMKSESSDLQGAIDKAMLEMCWTYYPLYANTDAIELPHWLTHCVLSENGNPIQ